MTTHKQTSAGDMATVLFGVLMGGIGLAVFLAGPSGLMPVHWGLDGQADAWSTRELVGGTIAGLGFLTLLLAGGMGLAAGRSKDATRVRALRFAQLVLLLSLTLVALLIGSASLGGMNSLRPALPTAAIALILLVIGAYLGRVGANPIVGVRTPWSYRSRLAWERSNRLAGRLMFLLGVSGLATAAFAPQPLGLLLLLLGVLITAIWSVLESWRVWRADPDRQPF